MSTKNALALTEPMLVGTNCATMRRPEGVGEMGERYEELAVVRFEGGRFASHKLEVDATQELIAYKKLVSECAKELWRRRNPNRVRLPGGYEDGFAIVFSEIRQGSVQVPLQRRVETDEAELPLGVEDEFAHAARLVDLTISSAGSGLPLPNDLPRNVIPWFKELGKTLAANETLYTRAVSSPVEAAYTHDVRQRLANWTESAYQHDVDLVGEVSMANVRGGHFILVLENGATASGRFAPEQEHAVLEALLHHRNVRMHIKGVGEFNQQDGSLRRIARVDEMRIVESPAQTYDANARPIWEVIAEMGDQAPPGTWDNVPSDLSERLDEYIYGKPRKPR